MTSRMPRDEAGSVDLSKDGGTGPIKAVVNCGDHLETYKKDATIRIRTPEAIDPARKHPDIPWEVKAHADIGSAHPVIARVMIQGDEMLKHAGFGGENDRDIRHLLWQCKEEIVSCYEVAESLRERIDKSATAYLSSKASGRVLRPPTVPRLVNDADLFLVTAKRALRWISSLPVQILGLKGHAENFDYLARILSDTGLSGTMLYQFVEDQKGVVARIISLRNHREHPKEKATEIHDFRLLEDGQMAVPSWQLTGEIPEAIHWAAPEISKLLIELAEITIIGSVLAHNKNWPLQVIEIPVKEMDPDCPTKYCMTIDVSKFPPGPLSPGNS